MKKQITKKVFDKEVAMCAKLAKKKGGKCAWGICKNCGVVPLLYKLYKGRLLEDPKEIKSVKNKITKI